MKVVSGTQPKFKKYGATSYRVLVNGQEVGRVGRAPGGRWWADALINDNVQDAGDFWPSRDAAARACIYFDS